MKLNLHFELLALLQRKRESGQEMRNLFQVFQAHDLDGRMHIAVWEADERRGNAAARPEDHVSIGAAGGRDGFVLKLDLPLARDRFQASHHFGMIGAAVGQGRALADFDISMLGLADRRVIRGVGDVDDQRHVRLERVSDLPRAEAAASGTS